jgi:hypothetical protein
MTDILYATPVKGNANNNSAPPPEHVTKPPHTMAGAYLCRRFCIHPEIADLVAALAGLDSDRRAA